MCMIKYFSEIFTSKRKVLGKSQYWFGVCKQNSQRLFMGRNLWRFAILTPHHHKWQCAIYWRFYDDFYYCRGSEVVLNLPLLLLNCMKTKKIAFFHFPFITPSHMCEFCCSKSNKRWFNLNLIWTFAHDACHYDKE